MTRDILFFASIIVYLLVIHVVYAEPTTVRNPVFTFDAPTTRVDGDPLDLTEISNATIYCGESSGVYSESWTVADIVEIGNTTTSTLTLQIRYCAATITDANGLESDYSNEIKLLMPPSKITLQ